MCTGIGLTILPQMNREPININNDDAQSEALRTHQKYILRKIILKKTPQLFSAVSAVAMQQEGLGCTE